MPKGLDRWHKVLVNRYLAEEHSSDAWPRLKIVQFVGLALVRQNKEAPHMDLTTPIKTGCMLNRFSCNKFLL